MKKSTTFLVILFLLLGHQVFSQNYIIKGGLNLATQLYKTNEGKLSSDYKLNPGFHLGVTMEYSLNEKLFIDFGLVLSQKGMKEESENYIYISNPLYLDLPIQLKYYEPISDELKLLGAFGPYFGIGFSGTHKTTLEIGGFSNTSTSGIRWGGRDTNSDYTNPDYGLIVGGGVEFKSFQLMLNYDLGIANISPTSFNDSFVRNRVLRFSLGYKLGS